MVVVSRLADAKSVAQKVFICTTVEPGFSRSVHARRSRETPRMYRPHQIRSDSPSQPLEPLRPEVCLVGPSSASGPSCVPTCHSTHTRQRSLRHLSGHFLSLHHFLSCPCLSPFLAFAFVNFSIDASHLPDVHRCCRVLRHVPAKIVKGSLCESPFSHVSAQDLEILTNCHGNDVHEITVGCWRVFHHGCHLNRLLDICACGDSVLGHVFLPRRTHVAKVTSITVHLLLSGTWVEDASQKRCYTISTITQVLILQHSPRFEPMTSRSQRNQRKRFTFALCDKRELRGGDLCL